MDDELVTIRISGGVLDIEPEVGDDAAEPFLLVAWRTPLGDDATDRQKQYPWATGQEGAEALVRAWADAPQVDYSEGETEWIRSFEYWDDVELYVTALCGDGSQNIDRWTGSSGVYYLADMPFDFDVEEEDDV